MSKKANNVYSKSPLDDDAPEEVRVLERLGVVRQVVRRECRLERVVRRCLAWVGAVEWRESGGSKGGEKREDQRVDVAPNVADRVRVVEARDHPATRVNQLKLDHERRAWEDVPRAIPQPDLQARDRLVPVDLKDGAERGPVGRRRSNGWRSSLGRRRGLGAQAVSRSTKGTTRAFGLASPVLVEALGDAKLDGLVVANFEERERCTSRGQKCQLPSPAEK